MAKRNNSFKVSASEDPALAALQGEDAFVVFNAMTYGKMIEIARNREERGEKKRTSQESTAENQELLNTYVVTWNWADESGGTLPLPKEGLKVEALTNAEVGWLIDKIFAGAAPPKNP